MQWHQFKRGPRTIGMVNVHGIYRQSGKKNWLYQYTPTPSDTEHFFLLSLWIKPSNNSLLGRIACIATDGDRWAGAVALVSGSAIHYELREPDQSDLASSLSTSDLLIINGAIQRWLKNE